MAAAKQQCNLIITLKALQWSGGSVCDYVSPVIVAAFFQAIIFVLIVM